MEDEGLQPLGQLTAEDFETLYDNHIRLYSADFFESIDPVDGGSEEAPAYIAFISCFLDEFDTELVSSVASDANGNLDFKTTIDFDYQVCWLLGEFFTKDSFAEIAQAGRIFSPIPTMVVIFFFCRNPLTFENVPVWTGGFTKDEFDFLGENPSHASIVEFLSSRRQSGDSEDEDTE